MELQNFREERERNWERLQKLIRRIENNGIEDLSYQELQELGGLYRLAVSSYMMLQDLSMDPALLRYLRRLVNRTYLAVYHYDWTGSLSPKRFYLYTWPRVIRKHWKKFAVTVFSFLLVFLGSFVMAYRDPAYADRMVPPQMASGRNSLSSREELKESLTSGRDLESSSKFLFTVTLFRHNTSVGFKSFALGAAGGVPALLMGIYNAVLLGAFTGLFHSKGLGYEFWAWILPHGITEFLAIFLCVQAGLILGLGLLNFGYEDWKARMKKYGREAGIVVIGTVPLFFTAGVIEGIFRQTKLSWETRYLVAFLFLVMWALYFAFIGRQEDPETDRFERRPDAPVELPGRS